MRHSDGGGTPPCFEPLIERSSEHELLSGADALPALRGVLHGYAFRFSFAVQDDDWDDPDDVPHRIRWHFVMDFPFGFDVRVRRKPAAKKKKGKSRPPAEATGGATGIARFDERFDAQATDAHLGRALPWLRDATVLEILDALCQSKTQVRMRVDSLNVSSAGWKGSLEEARGAVASGTWPEETDIERIAAAAQRLRGCFRRLGGAVGADSGTPAPAAKSTDPDAEALFRLAENRPPTPAQSAPVPAAAARPEPAPPAPSELLFIGDPPPNSPPPPKPEIHLIGFDEPEPPPPRPRIRPHTPFPPDPRPAEVIRITDTAARRPTGFSSTWDIPYLPQMAGWRRLASRLELQRSKEGQPDIHGEIGGCPFTLQVRWSGGRKNLAQASDFTLDLEMKCKPEFEATVHRESWALRWKRLTGTLQDIKVGRPTLDEKYFFSFTSGSRSRFTDLMLDAETEPILDALTDLCGSVQFSHEQIRVGVNDREVERPKANYDPFGEGVWPPCHFLDNLLPATHALAVRVNGLDTGLIFRRLRLYGYE